MSGRGLAQRLDRAARRLAIGLVLVQLGACTVVQVRQGDARIRWYPGVAQITLEPDEHGLAVVDSTGVGLLLGPRSATLGVAVERSVLAQPTHACRLFVSLPDAASVQRFMDWLRSAGALAHGWCAFSEQGEP